MTSKTDNRLDTSPTGGRVAEAAWRRSREETFDTHRRARAEVGRAADRAGPAGTVGAAEWRLSTPTHRPDIARVGLTGSGTGRA